MKKYLKYFLVAMLLLTLIPIHAFAATDVLYYDQKFSDVTANDVGIIYLHSKGIIQGNPDSTVGSIDPLNRAEAMTIFARYFDLTPEYDSSCTFSDVPSNVWYAGYVSALCKKGLVQGYPDGTFQPLNQLNRAEAFALMVRGLEIESTLSTDNLPLDVDSGAWYAKYAKFAKQHNLFDGSQTYFNGKSPYTRGEIFENLYRYSRIQELGEAYYNSSMDPTVVSNIAGKSSNVTFNVEKGRADYSTYINAIKDRGINKSGMDLYGKTYKNTAYEIANYYLGGALYLDTPLEFNKVISAVRNSQTLSDSQIGDEVKEFYSHFGVSVSDINAIAPNSDVNNVIDQIIEMTNTYKTLVGDVRLSFITESDTKIMLRFDGYCNGIYYWYNDRDPQYALAFDAGLSNIHSTEGVEVTDSTDAKLATTRVFNDCETVERKNAEGYSIILKQMAFYQVELQEPLVDGETYTLSIPPTLLTKVIDSNLSGEGGIYGTGIADKNVILPAMTVTFEKNSAKEIVYQGKQDDSVAGVGIVGDVRYSWPSGSIYAVPYDSSGRPLDFNYKDMNYTIINGDATVTDSGKENIINFNSIGEVELQVEYRGFTDTIKLFYTGEKSI